MAYKGQLNFYYICYNVINQLFRISTNSLPSKNTKFDYSIHNGLLLDNT